MIILQMIFNSKINMKEKFRFKITKQLNINEDTEINNTAAFEISP